MDGWNYQLTIDNRTNSNRTNEQMMDGCMNRWMDGINE